MSDLDERSLPTDPVALFETWYSDAREARNVLPNAMALATTTADGLPSVRFVLLKQFDRAGFVFFSNYESRKGVELDAHPRAAAAMFWLEPRRQVRFEGPVTKIPPAESDAYFETRDRGSQVGAWASPQSQIIAGRAELEAQIEALQLRFEGRSVPRPDNWGGYLVSPDRFEFWSEGKDRLHDRIVYRLTETGLWRVERLAP